MPTNPFVWFDNMSGKSDDTADFLSKNFGWNKSQFGEMNVLSHSEDGPFADTVKVNHGIEGWVPFVEIDDLAEATSNAKSNGAKVVAENIDGPAGVATFIRDPGGAPLALWKRHAGES